MHNIHMLPYTYPRNILDVIKALGIRLAGIGTWAPGTALILMCMHFLRQDVLNLVLDALCLVGLFLLLVLKHK